MQNNTKIKGESAILIKKHTRKVENRWSVTFQSRARPSSRMLYKHVISEDNYFGK